MAGAAEGSAPAADEQGGDVATLEARPGDDGDD
jgi:hypothetical protein